MLSLDTGVWRELGPGSQAQFLAPAHLVYHAIGVREGELHAAAFDIERRALNGTPVSVLENIFRAPDAGAAYFAVAQNGTVVFARGGYERTLVRVDRAGQRTPLLDERRGYRMPAVSPDGRSVAITIDPRPSQVWVYDIPRKSRIPLAIDGHSLSPLWTPDGRRHRLHLELTFGHLLENGRCRRTRRTSAAARRPAVRLELVVGRTAPDLS